MPRNRRIDLSAPFQTIGNTARITGISQFEIRRGVKAGAIPFVRRGSGNAPYLVNVPAYLRQLEAEAQSNLKGGVFIER